MLGNMVTITGAGIVKVRASQAGNANYAAAVPVDQSFTVAVVHVVGDGASNNAPSLAGVPITLTATVSPTAATGAVTFKDGAAAIACASGSALSAPVATCKTSALAVGTHAITAVYAGNASLAGSTSPAFSQVISPSAKLLVNFNVYRAAGQHLEAEGRRLPGEERAGEGVLDGEFVRRQHLLGSQPEEVGHDLRRR